MGEEFNIEEVKGFSIKREIYDWVESGVAALVCMILVFTLLGRVIGVVGDSMLPTLEDNDRLIISRVLYSPSYGDIVVVTKPNYRGEPLIKRIIATEGQTIEVDGKIGLVLVDGEIIDEPYIAELTMRQGDWDYPLTVPEGHVFVMGDNRNYSMDSRSGEVGMVDSRYILGKVYYRMLPLPRMGNPYQVKERLVPAGSRLYTDEDLEAEETMDGRDMAEEPGEEASPMEPISFDPEQPDWGEYEEDVTQAAPEEPPPEPVQVEPPPMPMPGSPDTAKSSDGSFELEEGAVEQEGAWEESSEPDEVDLMQLD